MKLLSQKKRTCQFIFGVKINYKNITIHVISF